MNGNKYRSNVSVNGASAVASNIAVLNVGPDVNLDATTTTNCPATSNTINTAGTAGVSYQWQVSTNSGTGWTNVVAGADPSGVSYTINTGSLVISALTNAIDGYQYRYIANDGAGCVVTSAATTQKVPALAAFGLPGAGTITANVGDAVNIPVTVTAGTAPFTYQWQVAVGAGAYSNILNSNASYTGPTTGTLGIPSVTSATYNNKYRVIIKNAGGCTSASASFAQVGLPVTLPVTITSFTAERLGGTGNRMGGTAVRLSWTVDAANVPQSFGVERAMGGGFSEVGSVKGQSGKAEYGFVDAGVSGAGGSGAGVEYRLRVSGSGGLSLFSTVVRLSGDVAGRRFGLRPSFTASGSTSLYTVLDKNETIQMTMTDILGRVLLREMVKVGRGKVIRR
ncbi:hypothetical protein ACQ86N_37400 [Puia sp. P3]|uniref:hypothetical protein n=1 Tax=Puia sp. P3 TaxID=3423952 RepID=UPI003D665F49